MKPWPLLLIAVLAIAVPADAARIACITGASIIDDPGENDDDLSATSIRSKGKANAYNIEIYSDDDAQSAPTTCTATDGTVVTCNGWDGTGAAQIWFRCDRNAPWLQMDDTSTYTSADNVGRVLTSDCQVRLKLTNDGSTNSACLYLSIVGGGLDANSEVQDGRTRGGWAETF